MPEPLMIQPVILCGGDGTRLWPASRKALPKQFMSLHNTTLFKQTLIRAMELPNSLPSFILCNTEHRFLAAYQIQEVLEDTKSTLGRPKILLEPYGRNTAPAITFAALHAEKDDPILLVLPSDHILKNLPHCYEAIQKGSKAAAAGRVVTFGVIPTHPETGYGYIETGEPFCDGVFTVKKFVEKPNLATAKEMLTAQTYLWNSGMFLFRASTYLNELKHHAPAILTACKAAYEGRSSDLDFIRLEEKPFAGCPADSIDYAVMEHTDKACVVPLDAEWSDLGSWQSIYAIEQHDTAGNAFSGDVISEGCSNSFVISQHRLVAALGLDDIVIVETPDAVMVAHKERSQDVKKIVATLKEAGRLEAELHARVYRPWGSYESLITGPRFQVKRLMVFPGQQLSLQRHFHRAEHWVVVRGTAQVTVNGKDFILGEDESTYIPVGGVHRLANPGKLPLEIVEIQTGGYLGEDDIERLEDDYGR